MAFRRKHGCCLLRLRHAVVSGCMASCNFLPIVSSVVAVSTKTCPKLSACIGLREPWFRSITSKRVIFKTLCGVNCSDTACHRLSANWYRQPGARLAWAGAHRRCTTSRQCVALGRAGTKRTSSARANRAAMGYVFAQPHAAVLIQGKTHSLNA